MKVPMKSNFFCITSFFENEFEYANELYTNRICPKYIQIGLFFSFNPTTIKLYIVKVYMKSNFFCITSFFENEFVYANELYTNRICPKYIQIGLFFSFTPTTIKLYIVKVYMKSNFFCITSFFLNEFRYAHEHHTYCICPNCIGRNTIPLAGTTKPGSFQVRGQSKSSIAITHWQKDRKSQRL